MVSLNPKKLFCANEQAAASHRALCRSNEMQQALAFTMAEFAVVASNEQQLSGAKNFVRIFLQLAEPETAQAALPDKANQIHKSLFPET